MTENGLKAVKVIVTPELLRMMMSLPENARIVNAKWHIDDDSRAGYVALIVESDDLPSVPLYEPLPIAEPVFRQKPDDRVPSVEFVEWGIK